MPCCGADREHRCLLGCSLVGRQGSFERIQASLFVEVDRLGGGLHLWRGSAAVGDLRALLARYVGAERAEQALAGHAECAAVAWRRCPGRPDLVSSPSACLPARSAPRRRGS